MVNRTVIGQAEGILMERLGVQDEHVFAYLRRISQDTNRTLLDVAEELVLTRELPSGAPAPNPQLRRLCRSDPRWRRTTALLELRQQLPHHGGVVELHVTGG